MVRSGLAAAAPSVPFGTIFEYDLPQQFVVAGIPTVVEIADRGSAVTTSEHVDVAIITGEASKDYALAMAWGIRRVDAWQFRSNNHRDQFYRWQQRHELQ